MRLGLIFHCTGQTMLIFMGKNQKDTYISHLDRHTDSFLAKQMGIYSDEHTNIHLDKHTNTQMQTDSHLLARHRYSHLDKHRDINSDKPQKVTLTSTQIGTDSF